MKVEEIMLMGGNDSGWKPGDEGGFSKICDTM